MTTMTHPATGFTLGDPYANPLSRTPTPEQAAAFFDGLILSASGWRGVFGADDDDLSETLEPSRLYVAARMAAVFADRLLETAPSAAAAPVVALGMDSRPSGPAIAEVALRVFLAKGLRVRCAFILAAPEIMAWARRSGALPAGHPDRIDAFCYVSASHNPPGHNGLKFGLADGGVLPAPEAGLLTSRLRDGACTAADIGAMAALCGSPSPKAVAAALSACTLEKRKAVSDYSLFMRETAADEGALDAQERELDALADAVRARGCGIVAEMNGSARSLSIDPDFLSALGATVRSVNDRPRAFAHRIVPEGASLDDCRRELEAAHAADPAFTLGYVPDCDGDRGNIVIWDDAAGAARPLEAQETYALALLSELAVGERHRLLAAARGPRDGSSPGPGPVAVGNDATSLRADAIALALGAEFRRAETGEANVVGLARRLRGEGHTVRILGEGSNGGVITHPAAVRDPLNTVTALLKLLCLRDSGGVAGPWKLWLERSGQADRYREDFSLADVVASLPAFVTTSVFEDRAALRVATRDHAALKAAYEAAFLRGWPDLARRLEPRYGILSWKAVASVGMVETELEGDFAASGSGGLKILMSDPGGSPAAFLWMRGSGTEPVFRVMADARGADPAVERLLLETHAAWVREADASCARAH